MQSTSVSLEAFDSGSHAALLAGWLQQPHVRRWWGDPAVALQFALTCSADAHALIAVDGNPVGYLCWRELTREEVEQSGLSGLPEGLIDIDICIGEHGALGRGVGSQALVLLLARLRERAEAPAAGVGTSVENRRALRAFEKAGFRAVCEFRDPLHGQCRYLVADGR